MEQHRAAFEELAISRHLLSCRYETKALPINVGCPDENDSISGIDTDRHQQFKINTDLQ